MLVAINTELSRYPSVDVGEKGDYQRFTATWKLNKFKA